MHPSGARPGRFFSLQSCYFQRFWWMCCFENFGATDSRDPLDESHYMCDIVTHFPENQTPRLSRGADLLGDFHKNRFLLTAAEILIHPEQD